MKRVGIRELRQNASAILRLVEQGARIEITDRGRPVAVLSPSAALSPLEHLRESGSTVAARRRLEDLPPPIPVPAGMSPSEALMIQREERLGPLAQDNAE
jgi:prevent-host-death family protein